jgi:hypothetical protein
MFSRWIVTNIIPRALPHSSHSLRGSSPGLCTVLVYTVISSQVLFTMEVYYTPNVNTLHLITVHKSSPTFSVPGDKPKITPAVLPSFIQ